jgi:Zn-dependent protease
MPWSFGVGKVAGIKFRIHWTFVLLLAFVFFAARAQYGTERATWSVLFICAIFACVLIHEMSHSIIGRHFGVQARSITLLPIGGIAAMDEIPDKPGQEVAISIIGPFINLVIAGVLYAAVGWWTGIGLPDLFPDSVKTFMAGLIGANLLLAVFNMIPAFPMDGGRVFRSLLALRMDYMRATSTAVTVGHVISIVFVFYGIFYNWWLAIIGVFLYLGASGEQRHVQVRTVLHQVPARQVMTTNFETLSPDDRVSRCIEHVFHGYQEDFPVVDGGGLQGMLTRNGLISAVHRKGTDIPVSEAMDPDCVAVGPDVRLDEVYKRLTGQNKTVSAVVDDGHLLGLLSLEGIGRYFMVRSASGGSGPGPDNMPPTLRPGA